MNDDAARMRTERALEKLRAALGRRGCDWHDVGIFHEHKNHHPLARWEVQGAVLNNLRQIDAARKKYTLDKGNAPASIAELVGPGSYVKTVRTVDGEDYTALSMSPDASLTVTTPDGIKVTYDPSGVNTTAVDYPPELLRLRQKAQQMQGQVSQALTAYRAANNGSNPANEMALVPFFPTPQQGADFVELQKAQKAAGK